MIQELAGALIGGAADLFGGLSSQANARDNYRHRYQDTVQDLRKAGLNPALAYGQNPGGGAQTTDFSQIGSRAISAGRDAASAKQTAAQAALTAAQTDLLKAQRDDLVATTHNKRQASEFAPSNAQSARNLMDEKARMAQIERQVREYTQTSDMETRISANERQKILTYLTGLDRPQAEAASAFFRSWLGKHKNQIDMAGKAADLLIRAWEARSAGGATSARPYQRIYP